VDAGGVGDPFQAALGGFADQVHDRPHGGTQESTARPHHVESGSDVDVQAFKDQDETQRNSGQSSLGRDSISRPSTPAPPLNFSVGAVLMGILPPQRNARRTQRLIR